MANVGGIKAGKAFVEVYADKTKLTRTLKTIGADLKAFGAGVSSLGTKFMALGAGILAPLMLATKNFMTIGDQLDKMSARTGVSTNALSELGFAAEQSGANIEAVEKAVRKMQKTIADAASGEKTYVDALKAVGISYADLQGMSPEDQFTAIANGLNAIKDSTMKAAAAIDIFGKSGTALLPMLGDMKALRAEAVRLGLSIGPEQAKQAAAITDAWNRVKRSFGAVAVAIGSALAPMLTKLADKLKNGIGMVREWISANKGLIIGVFSTGVAAVAAGAGLFILGKAITLVGMAFTGLLAAGRAAVATFGLLQAAVLLLANPFVLVGAAAVALGGYLLYSSGVAGKVATWISQTFATILAEATETFGIIAESMAAGDFVSAAKVGWALVKMEWTKGTAFISGLWESFKQLYDEIVSGLAIGMINASAWIQSIWADLLNWMGKLWQKWATSTFQEGLADFIAPVMAKILGVDTDELRKTMHEDFSRKRAGQNDKFAAMDADTAAKKKQIEADRKSQIEGIGGDLARRNAGRDAQKKAAQDAVDAARAEWDAAKKDARAKAAAKGSIFGFAGGIKGMDDIDLAAAGAKSSTRGTFSASAVAGLGMGGIQERIAKATEKTFMFIGQQTSVLKEVRDKLEAAP